MKTEVKWCRDRQGIRFEGYISDLDLERLRLDKLDRMVLSEPVEKASDFFQNAEIIFRRIEQQAEESAGDGS